MSRAGRCVDEWTRERLILSTHLSARGVPEELLGVLLRLHLLRGGRLQPVSRGRHRLELMMADILVLDEGELLRS